MDARIMPSDKHTHQSVQEMLPWFMTNALGDTDAALVREHLMHCARCREDLARQRRLYTCLPSVTSATPALDVERAFAKLQPRLEHQAERRARPAWTKRLHGLLPAGWRAGMSTQLGWLLAGQAALLGLTAILLAPPAGNQAAYRALSDTRTETSSIVVMFKPDTTEQQLRESLRASDARLVDGPTATGAYILAVPGAERERALQTALQALRANPTITLAEPLGRDGTR